MATTITARYVPGGKTIWTATIDEDAVSHEAVLDVDVIGRDPSHYDFMVAATLGGYVLGRSAERVAKTWNK